MARLRGAVTSAAALALGLGLSAAWADPAPPAEAPAQPQQALAQPAAVDAIVSATRQRLSSLSVAPAEKEDLAALVAFYNERGTPVWTAGTGFSAKGQEALAEIARADEWGLKATAFSLPSLTAGAPTEVVADAEAKLGLAVLKYARHARGGRLDPTKLSKYIYVRPTLLEPKAVLAAIAEAPAADAYLRSLHPKHPQFQALRQALMKLRGPQTAEAPAPAQPEPVRMPDGKTIKPGATDPDVALLRKRLQVPADPGADSVYDARLQTAVRVFQSENGIKADGVVTAKTRRALNAGLPKAAEPARPDRDAERLVLNMERWRWLPDDMGNLHVWDNIPEFMMRVVKGGEKIHEEKIIVGKTNTPTPSFSARMQYVIFHPEWGVPDSIKVKEILPYLRPSSDFSFFGGSTTDTRVLQRHNLRVSYNGQPVDASQIDWSKTDIRRYTFIQPSGGGNVLGVVKFRFPNKHDVYMHDTPQRDLFKQSVRTFSHGCMRVHNPQRLAEVLLGEDQGISPDQVRSMIANNNKMEITLKSQIPVHVTYLTAVADETGKVSYFNDIYGHDNRLSLALSGKQTEFYDPPTDGASEASLNGARPVRQRGKPQQAGPADFFAGLFGN